MKTNIFNTFWSKPFESKESHLKEIIELIKSPNQDLLDKILEVKQISKYLFSGKVNKEYSDIKNTLPAFSPNCSYPTTAPTKHIDYIQEFSGVVYFDVDFLDSNVHLLPIVKEYITSLTYVFACWVSSSNKGLSILVKAENVTIDNFYNSYMQIQEAINITSIDASLEFDSTSNVNRVCFLTFDPNIYVNNQAIPFKVDVPDDAERTNVEYSQIGLNGLINYKTILGEYDNKPYKIFWKGKEFRETFFRYQIREGKRNKCLSELTKTICFNNPSVSYDTLLNEMLKNNEAFCIIPLEFNEVEKMVSFYHKKLQKGTLKVVTRKKYVWFNPLDFSMTKEEKCSVSGKVGKKVQKNSTIQKIKAVYTEGMTVKQIVQLTDCKKSNVYKLLPYVKGLKEFKLEIEDKRSQNLEISEESVTYQGVTMSKATYDMFNNYEKGLGFKVIEEAVVSNSGIIPIDIKEKQELKKEVQKIKIERKMEKEYQNESMEPVLLSDPDNIGYVVLQDSTPKSNEPISGPVTTPIVEPVHVPEANEIIEPASVSVEIPSTSEEVNMVESDEEFFKKLKVLEKNLVLDDMDYFN